MSNLVLDPEIETYYMMNVIIDIIPDISEGLGFIRRTISGKLAHGRLDREEFHALLAAKGRFDAAAQKYHYSVAMIEANDPENVSNKVEKEVRALDGLGHATALFEHIVDQQIASMKHDQFFKHISVTFENSMKCICILQNI